MYVCTWLVLGSSFQQFHLLQVVQVDHGKSWGVARALRLPVLEHVVVDGGDAFLALVPPQHDDLPHLHTVRVAEV